MPTREPRHPHSRRATLSDLRRKARVCGLLWCFGAGAALAACSAKDADTDSTQNESEVKLGALFVEVVDATGAPVADAKVTTEPATKSGRTDELGSVLLRNLEPGYYLVIAEHAQAGQRSDASEIEAGEISRVTLRLPSRATEGGSMPQPAVSPVPDEPPNEPVAIGPDLTQPQPTTEPGPEPSAPESSAPESSADEPSGGVNVAGEIDVATQVEKMLLDPERPYLYALDRVNNSLHFVNTEDLSVEKTIFVGSGPVDLDLAPETQELFIANFGSTEISVVDLETQEVGRTLFVDTSLGTWQGNPYRLALTANGTFVFTSEDQWNDLELVTRQDGAPIATAGSVYQPDLVASPDGTRVYVAESGSTGSALIRFDVSEDGLTENDTSPTASSYGSRLAVISGDGKYVFYAGMKVLADNLQSVLGEFGEIIQASNEDGSLAIGTTNIFNGDTFAIVRPLAVASDVLALSKQAELVYLYDINRSTISVQDISDL